jgi:transcriptional regulator with XRE-family HTH domain
VSEPRVQSELSPQKTLFDPPPPPVEDARLRKRTEPDPEVALTLRREREALGWTQAKLAREANISLSAVRSYERAYRYCSDKTLEKLSRVLAEERELRQPIEPPMRPRKTADDIEREHRAKQLTIQPAVPFRVLNNPLSLADAVAALSETDFALLNERIDALNSYRQHEPEPKPKPRPGDISTGVQGPVILPDRNGCVPLAALVGRYTVRAWLERDHHPPRTTVLGRLRQGLR